MSKTQKNDNKMTETHSQKSAATQTHSGTSSATAEASFEKKITTKIVVEKIDLEALEKAGSLPLYHVIGVVNSHKVAKTQYGESIGFVGMFEAVRISDGKMFSAPVCYLPEPASGIMYGALQQAYGRAGGEVGVISLEFAYTVGVKWNAKLATKYEYTVRPLMEASRADALSKVRALLPPITHALPDSQ